MIKNPLPVQILILACTAFVALQIILWGSLISVRSKMNTDAARESLQRMEGRINTLQSQVSLIASDYHNWTDIFLNAQALDYERLASNYGITAERGDVFQFAELYDGPFPHPISWREGRGLLPQEGFIDEDTRAALRRRVTELNVIERQTFNYFEFREDELVMFSSSRLLPEHNELMANLDPQAQAIALIGKILSENHLASIGSEFSMRDLEVVSETGRPGTVHVPALGVSGEPVAWLEWYPPPSGTVMFKKMSPIMALISLLFAGILYFAANLLRHRAAKLIADEAISFTLARTDALTALPNRLAMHDHLCSIADEKNEIEYAIISLDLTNFKRINDNVGHNGGDRFLKVFASRLQALVDDETFIARLGGDEFILVASSVNSIERIVADKVAALDEVTRQQITCNGVAFDVLVSKGLAVTKCKDISVHELLRRADRALYAAKVRCTQKIVRYDDFMAHEDQNYLSIESCLRRALVSGDGFSIVYQPIVSAADMNKVVHFEALARWNCSDLGQIPPDKFIHVAETSGLMSRLGWLLLDLICRDIKDFTSVKVGINISPMQLMVPGFADSFIERVKANGVIPEQIELEVTEQIVARDDTTIVQELNMLSKHGFRLALDDFGTGYASIGYLTRMPFDILKIDRTFAKCKSESVQLQKIVHSIMGLAHAMDLKIVAEGIETSEDAVFFRDLGADFLQGYHFGRPSAFSLNSEPSLYCQSHARKLTGR